VGAFFVSLRESFGGMSNIQIISNIGRDHKGRRDPPVPIPQHFSRANKIWRVQEHLLSVYIWFCRNNGCVAPVTLRSELWFSIYTSNWGRAFTESFGLTDSSSGSCIYGWQGTDEELKADLILLCSALISGQSLEKNVGLFSSLYLVTATFVSYCFFFHLPFPPSA
jgi:hypothetical protein